VWPLEQVPMQLEVRRVLGLVRARARVLVLVQALVPQRFCCRPHRRNRPRRTRRP
jgi:hypothetical protein